MPLKAVSPYDLRAQNVPGCDGICRAAAGRIMNTHSMAKIKLAAVNIMQVHFCEFVGIMADIVSVEAAVMKLHKDHMSRPNHLL